MKKINLKGISEILSEKELKNVTGGSGNGGNCASPKACDTKKVCYFNGYSGHCMSDPTVWDGACVCNG